MTILAVDDEALSLDDLKLHLSDLGYEDVVFAMDALEALRLVALKRPSVALMDIRMPGNLDGIDAAHVLVSLYNIPVIFVTAVVEQPVMDLAIRVGALGYLVKPMHRGTLETTLQLVAYNWKLQASQAINVTLAIDSSLNLTFLNRPAESIFGPEAQSLGKPLTDFVSPESTSTVDDLLKQPIGVPIELQVQSNQHGRRILQFTTIPIRVDERLFGYRLFARDVTEDLEKRARFLREQRLNVIGSMTAGIIHDLNNALTPIVAGSGILMERESNPETQRIIHMMAASAQHGGALVKQLLAFTKGSPSIKNRNVDAAAIVREVGETIKPLFPKEVTITVSAEGPVPVFGSADELRQALMNLCVNARDAMNGRGKLALKVTTITLSTGSFGGLPAGKYCVMSVTDSGPGVPPQLRDQIFTPFFSTKGSNGTGLGLSTVARIVHEMGGAARLGDTDEGAAFDLLLPLTNDFPAKAQAPEDEPQKGNGEWIVVADDNSTASGLTRQMLEARGYNVLMARNGLEAIKAVGENLSSVRLVILDMEMPFMNGEMASAKLKELNKSLRIIMTRGSIPESRPGEFSSIDSFVDKPYTKKELLTVVRTEIAKYR
jgi:signal transduction histidine kinase